jgi:NAD(P)-dependent dehydrogenase (short-subunit alcohol dehydrogenase family)
MRAALVTGAASGIGRAIAARLERDGARVLVAAVRGDVVVLGHAPLVRRDGFLVRPDLQCHRSSSTDLTG